MIWVCQRSQPSFSITLWKSRDEAQAAACAAIMDDVNHKWDLSNPDEVRKAESISDACMAMRFDDAIFLYNDWMRAKVYSIYERSIQTTPPNIHLLGVKNVAMVQPPIPTPAQPFRATKPGATCRGPCGNFNDYAYADQPDDTYCCYQCRYMSQVFGGNIS